MADYFNLLNHVWKLEDSKRSFRITEGVNRNLPQGLEAKFPKMLKLIVPSGSSVEHLPTSTIPSPGVSFVVSPTVAPSPAAIPISPPAEKLLADDSKEDLLKKLSVNYEKKVKEIEVSDKSKRSKAASLKFWKEKYDKDRKVIVGK
jgi:hypothetical protein